MLRDYCTQLFICCFFFVLTGCLALWPKVLRLAWEICVTSLQSTTPSSLATKLLREFRLQSKKHRLSRTETTWFGQRCSGPAFSILVCTDLSTVALINAVINGPMLKLIYGLQNNCNKLDTLKLPRKKHILPLYTDPCRKAAIRLLLKLMLCWTLHVQSNSSKVGTFLTSSSAENLEWTFKVKLRWMKVI